MNSTPFLNPSDFLEDESFLISFNMALICQRICDVQTRRLKEYDLTPRQLLVLAYLYNHPKEEVTQKILENRMHLSNPTVTVIIQSMLSKGLVSKTKDPLDRRKHILHITPKGKTMFESSHEKSHATGKACYKSLNKNDLEFLKRIMRTIMGNLENLNQ